MSFTDLEEFFDSTLRLPIGGKTYTIPSPDAKTGLFVQTVWIARTTGDQSAVLDDDDERELYERILGPAYQEMLADGVTWHKLRHAGTTTLLWIVFGRGKAEEFWNAGGGQGKAPGKKPKRKRSKSTASAAPQA